MFNCILNLATIVCVLFSRIFGENIFFSFIVAANFVFCLLFFAAYVFSGIHFDLFAEKIERRSKKYATTPPLCLKKPQFNHWLQCFTLLQWSFYFWGLIICYFDFPLTYLLFPIIIFDMVNTLLREELTIRLFNRRNHDSR